jgi:hypothetical protein
MSIEAAVSAEKECPCTNADCQRHGDCVACFVYHTHKPEPDHVICLRHENTTLPMGLKERVGARLQAAGIPIRVGVT